MVEIIKNHDYWDGPLRGVCRYEGRVSWFECVEVGGWIPTDSYRHGEDRDYDACCTPRVWSVYPLSLMQRAELWVEQFAAKLLFAPWFSRFCYQDWPSFPKPECVPVGAFSDAEVSVWSLRRG